MTARSLARRPVYSLAVVVSLALGVGAATAAFSVNSDLEVDRFSG
jgi:hypothetical protein